MRKLLALLLVIFCGCATPPYTRDQETAAYKDGYKCGMYMSRMPLMRHHYSPRQFELKALKDAWYRGYYDGLGFTRPETWDKQP